MQSSGGPRNSSPGTLPQLFFDAVTRHDKPDAHLDPEARRNVEPLIATGAGRSRVIVSHDREAAAAGSDSILELG